MSDRPVPPDLDTLVRIATTLQALCGQHGLSVATAESCTGGLVAHAITEVAGSSAYFRGGIVAYSNAVKEEALGVPADVIRAHGAVSAQVARAMAEGARRTLHSDLAVSVTGVAGPDGGTDEKPVGLAYVATVGPSGIEVRRLISAGDRRSIKLASAEAALRLLLEAAQPATR